MVGSGPNVVGAPRGLASRELRFASLSSFVSLPSVIVCFYCLSALPAHSPAGVLFFVSFLCLFLFLFVYLFVFAALSSSTTSTTILSQNETTYKVVKRSRETGRKKMTNTVTPTVLAGERNGRRKLRRSHKNISL